MKRRLTVYLSDELLFKIKLLALQRGVSVSKLVESLLIKEVQQSPESKK
ncbi:MAG: DUF6364 family protein [Desulfurococcaceae archaeon]